MCKGDFSWPYGFDKAVQSVHWFKEKLLNRALSVADTK